MADRRFYQNVDEDSDPLSQQTQNFIPAVSSYQQHPPASFQQQVPPYNRADTSSANNSGNSEGKYPIRSFGKLEVEEYCPPRCDSARRDQGHPSWVKVSVYAAVGLFLFMTVDDVFKSAGRVDNNVGNGTLRGNDTVRGNGTVMWDDEVVVEAIDTGIVNGSSVVEEDIAWDDKDEDEKENEKKDEKKDDKNANKYDEGDAAGGASGKAEELVVIPDEDSVAERADCYEPDSIMNLKDVSTVSNKKDGAVATDNALCSEMALTILRDKNGSAIDAAVTGALCLGVVNPASSGIGGGAFILLHTDDKNFTEPSKKNSKEESSPRGKITEVIDCRETASSLASQEMYLGLPPSSSIDGGLAIAIPGELRGLELMHRRHGSLPWYDLVEPVAKLAHKGFIVSAELAAEIDAESNKIRHFEELSRLFTKDADGLTLLKEGDLLKQTKLAETLARIALDGADHIYKGPVAASIVEEIKNSGGILTLSDLEDYEPRIREPLIAEDIMGYTMVGVPPPSSGGGAVIGIARFLSGYANPYSSFKDGLSKHRLVEGMKHAFAVRMSLSDPDFQENADEDADAIKDLIEGDYMESLRQITSDEEILPLDQYGGKKWAQVNLNVEPDTGVDDKRKGGKGRNLIGFHYLEDHGTSHLSIIDKDGNTVALTSTVNTRFGSGVVSKTTGIIFNNQMDDFATPGRPNTFGLTPSPSNYIKPGKRPLSSMSPMLVFYNNNNAHPSTEGSQEETARSFGHLFGSAKSDPPTQNNQQLKKSNLGKLFMSLGASGGPKIITAVTQTFLNHAILGMPLFDSIADPRIHNQLLTGMKPITKFDKAKLLSGAVIELKNRTKAALMKRGQSLMSTTYTGTVQAISVDMETDTLTAVSDIRKYGSPAGY